MQKRLIKILLRKKEQGRIRLHDPFYCGTNTLKKITEMNKNKISVTEVGR